MLEKLPRYLVLFRFVLGPVIVFAYFLDAQPYIYGLILTFGFLSDYFDGVIARRLGVSTSDLRSLDSWADTTFYMCVFAVALSLYHSLLDDYWVAIAVLITLEVIRHVYDRVKYGRSASYHMWSAKFWGLCLYLAFMQLLVFGETQYVFMLAIVVGIISDLEGLFASIVLSSWKADVPSLYHAIKLEKSNRA